MKLCKIYSLNDPDTGSIKYVGRTVQPLGFRLQNHIHDAKRGKAHARGDWIRALLEAGKKPDIELLEVVPNEQSRLHEKRWMLKLQGDGLKLVNSNLAGGGCTHPKTIIEWTPEIEAMFGNMADSIIAEKIGVTRKSVSYHRMKLGIPASYDRTRNTPPPPMGGHNRKELPEHIISRLGKEPDYVLGDEIGVAKTVIARARRSKNIPTYRETTGNNGKFKKGDRPRRWLKEK